MNDSSTFLTEKDRARLVRAGKHLANKLDELGFRAKLSNPQRLLRPWIGWGMEVASFPGLPTVAIYFGNFLKPDGKHFWIGFETKNRGKIENLTRTFSEHNRQKISRYNLTLRNYKHEYVRIANEKPHYVEEADAEGWIYFGQYQFESQRSDRAVATYGKAFIDDVVNAFISLERPFPRSADKRTTRDLMVRRGQPEFRKRLMTVYGSQCAISGCTVKELLEAAHIVPYSGNGKYDLSNGLLLRSDLHNLFDLGLLRIEPQTMKVAIDPTITDKGYRNFDGQLLKLPKSANAQPSIKALRQSWLR